MLAAIKGAIRAVISTVISVITLPFRVLSRLLGGASATARKGTGRTAHRGRRHVP